MKQKQSLLGYFFIISGFVLLGLGIWNLIFRVIIGFLGIYFINYGLKLNGQPSLFFIISRFITMIFWQR